MTYAVSSAYRKGSASMSRSSVSRNRNGSSRWLYRNAISSRYSPRCLTLTWWYEPMIERLNSDQTDSMVLL